MRYIVVFIPCGHMEDFEDYMPRTTHRNPKLFCKRCRALRWWKFQ